MARIDSKILMEKQFPIEKPQFVTIASHHCSMVIDDLKVKSLAHKNTSTKKK